MGLRRLSLPRLLIIICAGHTAVSLISAGSLPRRAGSLKVALEQRFTMKICYLMLLHHKFDQALRLVSRLAGSESSFVFHVDASADAKQSGDFRARLARLADTPVHYAESVSSAWGSYRQALAIRRCVEVAYRDAAPCDRYVLLSGQDYPIVDRAHIAEFFANNPDREFLEAFPQDVADAAAPGWSPYYRFRRYHFWIGNRRVVLPFLRKGLPPLPVYHGSTWWALTRAAIEHLVRQFESNAPLKRYLRTGFLVDEVYVPTLMMASPLASKVTGQNVTYAEWTPTSGAHPKTLRIGDLAALSSSPKLFARKFDDRVDGSVMDRLDAVARASSGGTA